MTTPETPRPAPLTPHDESFTHQLVAPKLTLPSASENWGERSYYLLTTEDGTILNAGRQWHANLGRRFAFVGIRHGGRLHAVVGAPPPEPGGDPDVAQVGQVRIEVVRPLEELRLVVDDPALPVAVDLTYRGRLPAVATDVNRIVQGGEVVTEYMNFFQSGSYSGTIVVDGEEVIVRDRRGFRDRGWGIRKHEGSPARGLVLAAFCELPDGALYLILNETARAERRFTNGWLIGAAGVEDRVAVVEHELDVRDSLLRGGRLDVTLSSGRRLAAEFEIAQHLFLTATGYRREGGWGLDGHRAYDVGDPAVVDSLYGQTDCAARFRLDGREGYGYVETGIGTHSRYRPETAS